MAESFSHKWGQIIGGFIQHCIRETLQEVANQHGLSLDYQRQRNARLSKKVSWQDRYGNSHDLDYVLERGGSENALGLPAAFIETAWRRYTKHSRNKVQEIEGALIPLAETYNHLHPFLGAILAGVFTKASLNQLKSKGFEILYIQYDSLIDAFASLGIDASFQERTSETEFQNKIARWEALSKQEIAHLKNQLLSLEKDKIDHFIKSLTQSISREFVSCAITVLHGSIQSLATIDRAIEYLQNYEEDKPTISPALKYEVNIRYNTGDTIQGIFQSKAEAIRFLNTFA